MPQVNLDETSAVVELGLNPIEIAKAAGVELGFGTDLLGDAQGLQGRAATSPS